MLKINKGITRSMCQICSKLTMKRQKNEVIERRSGVFIVSLEQTSDMALVFLLLALNK